MALKKLDYIIDTKYPEYRKKNFYAGGKDGCGYFPLYENHLPESVDDFMEIGIAMGISIWMFRDYYDGIGNFHAMNYQFNHDNQGVIKMKDLEKTGIICYDGLQEDIDFLSTIKTQFDVIVEDGSHRSDHQAITFKHLFNNNIKYGGLYVIEDLHCCIGEYWWGTCEGYENTMLNFLHEYFTIYDCDLFTHKQTKKISKKTFNGNQFFSKEDYKNLVNTIDKIYIYSNSIAFIYKKWK